MNPIRQSTSQEPPMQASKWLDVQALLSADEMARLFQDLENPLLFQTGCVCAVETSSVKIDDFLAGYKEYVDILKSGQLPSETKFRALFSCALTVTSDVLFAIPIAGGREILRLSKPAVQMQFHCLGFSSADHSFRPMAFGTQSILWGVQFAYPQMYLDAQTDEAFRVDERELFPNTTLFKKLQRWMRAHTIPTPFLAEGKPINASVRLGKECRSWINRHPQLKLHQLMVLE